MFAIVDTNSNPNGIDFVIPANDDATKSIDVIVTALTEAIQEGLEERKVEKVDSAETSEESEEVVVKERKQRVSRRPRTRKEDEDALKANVVRKFTTDDDED